MIPVKYNNIPYIDATKSKIKIYRIKEITYPKDSKIYLISKRAIDILCAILGLLLLSPIFIIIAVCIKLDDGGPVIHTQTRVGKNGKFFKLHKFRSMSKIKEGQTEFNIYKMDGNIPIIKSKDDKRVTKVGKFIRKTSIDELPQLWDILIGNMSFVGPRPPVVIEAYYYDHLQMQTLRVKQGLTGYWQCYGRTDTSYKTRINMDMKYINNRGILMDIKLMLLTIPNLIRSKGSY
ncbi:MAG: sugar transferase [Oscillospiraceae bacterium]|nr:sugar transferase [Oscillospiraceae bacterium]